jgi:mono/diheme cytochrome c family protein
MKKFLIVSAAVFFVLAGLVFSSLSAQAGNHYQDGTLEQGRYIATISGCTACHTPKGGISKSTITTIFNLFAI